MQGKPDDYTAQLAVGGYAETNEQQVVAVSQLNRCHRLAWSFLCKFLPTQSTSWSIDLAGLPNSKQ